MLIKNTKLNTSSVDLKQCLIYCAYRRIQRISPFDERQTINDLRPKGSKVNVLRHKLLWINGRKPKDGMYPSDETLRINDYGTISLGFVTKPSEKLKSYNEITEINNLSVNIKHKIHGEATSSTLVEDLASHV
jgi:hypothetical protein